MLVNSTVNGNANRGGGGILNNGTLTITNSIVSNNLGGADGGNGIINYNGNLTLTSSTVSGNTGFLCCGAILIDYGIVTINASTISSNLVSGGIQIYHGILTVINSTVASNTGAGFRITGGTVTVINSTISGNDDGISTGNGLATLRNSIVANSTSDSNCAGFIVDDGHNLQFGGTVADSCGVSIPTADPLLAPLASNGGPTLTLALLPGSPAIDGGNPAAPGSGGNACEVTDQRGFARPVDGNSNGTATCDIGAFEFGAVALNNRIYLPLIQRGP